MRKWYDESNYLILLSVPDEQTLLEYASRLKEAGVPASLVVEPDLDCQATALAVAPSECNAMFSSLPLLGKEVAMV